ncbi:hypothetical protein LUZ60_010233 [Juncus effusus]|nr:hypothetical protein LUZ60_010233 [Juncus effusus]
MASAVTSSVVQASFDALEKQRELINTCTVLWKELSDHFTTLEQGIEQKSESLKSKRRFVDVRTKRALDTLKRREMTIDSSVDRAIEVVESRRRAAVEILESGLGDESAGIAEKLKCYCAKMDSLAFLDLVLSKRKEADLLRVEVPLALEKCVDPARFVVDALSVVFPVDKRETKCPTDVAWASVLVLESLQPVLSDPQLGSIRPLIPRTIRQKARYMADMWKHGLGSRGGVEGSKPPDAHAFLQLVVTFGIAVKEERGLYRKIVVSFSWRRQMPKLAMAVGLDDQMDDIIEELIAKGQQLDAVNFAYEAGLEENYPPVPLLKSYLEDSVNASSYSSDSQNQAGNNGRKEQSALRAVIKCIEDHKLDSEFPLTDLQNRLETLEKAKLDKKKTSSSPTHSGCTSTSTSTGGTNSTATSAPPNKRTRLCGPTMPSKAGRMTSSLTSSFSPVPVTAVVRSPSHSPYQQAVPAVPPPHHPYQVVYGNRSPYQIEESIAMPYQSPPYQSPTYQSPTYQSPTYQSPSYQSPSYQPYYNGVAGYPYQTYYR